MKHQVVCLVFGGAVLAVRFAFAAESTLPLAAQPAENTAGWVLPRTSSAARDIAANESRHFELVMVGDSFTECWKYGRGGPTQKRMLDDFRILNLGISGDTTRNVLWRFDQGFLDGYTADLFQVLIGGNNGGSDTPDDIKAAVGEIIRRIREKHPESKVLLLPLPPGASSRAGASGQRRNEKQRELVDGETVLWHDFSRRFYDDGDRISTNMLYDGQHPNVRAHEIWAEEIRPIVEKVAREAASKRKTVTVEVPPGSDLNVAIAEVNAKRQPGDRGEIVLLDGVYPIRETVELDAEASFVTIRAKNRGKATIVGGHAFAGADFKAVTDASILRRLPAAARGKALELALPANLKAQFEAGRHTGGGQWTYSDWNNYVPSKRTGRFSYPDFPCLTVDAKRQELARWPNGRDWLWMSATNIVSVGKGGKDTKISSRTGRERGWDLSGQNVGAAGWLQACGYLNCCTTVKGYDAASDAVVLADSKMAPGRGRVYFFNLPEEMDEPGEWCYDAKSGKVLMLPPNGFGRDSLCAFGATSNILFHVTGDGIALQGLTVTAKIFHPAVVIEGRAAGNEVRGCTFSGVGYDAVWVGGRRNAVRDCDFADIVSMAIGVQGGDAKTMIPACNWVDNNRIRHPEILCTTWGKCGIYLDGVGNRVSHNVVSDSVDGGIYFSGFDHVLEYNRVFDVCKEFDDVGVVYSPGVFRGYGVTFRYNDISGAPGQVVALYYDDCTSGHEAYGNVIRNGGEEAVLVGGGRDNNIHDNLIVGGFTGLCLDNRGLHWPGHVSTTDERKRAEFAKQWNITNRYAAIRRRYPRLYDWYTNDVPFRSYAGNRFERNVILDPSGFASVLNIGKNRTIDRKHVVFGGNLVVRTTGSKPGRDLILHPDEVATNEYSATVPLRQPIGECRVIDGTPEHPVDLGFVDNPGPMFDPWAYFGYPQQNWVERPKLFALRRECFKSLSKKPWRSGDFSLKPDARLLKELPSFKPIPWKEIGLYKTEWRDCVED